MKNKGFTLVELLAVIAILAVIMGLVIINASKIFDDRNEEDYENLKKLVIENTKTMVETNPKISDKIDAAINSNGNTSKACILDYQVLVDNNLMTDDIINPKTKTTFTGYVKLKIMSNYQYSYEFIDVLSQNDQQIPKCME